MNLRTSIWILGGGRVSRGVDRCVFKSEAQTQTVDTWRICTRVKRITVRIGYEIVRGAQAVVKKKTHPVSFKAKKEVPVKVRVDFKTRSGDEVAFPAHKKVVKKVAVKFRAKDK
jgi:hypothetical protein